MEWRNCWVASFFWSVEPLHPQSTSTSATTSITPTRTTITFTSISTKKLTTPTALTLTSTLTITTGETFECILFPQNPFLSERVRLCTGNCKWYLFSKHLRKVFVFQACKQSWELWEQKYHVEQEVQIYGTLPNTVYGTRHGMCAFLATFLWNFFALVSNAGHKVEKLSLKWIDNALISAQVCSPESTLGPVLFSFP